jgi:hypothetical protein
MTASNELYLQRLMFMLQHPTAEMIEVGRKMIVASVVAEYIGATASKDIFSAMLGVALKQAEA